MQIFVLIHIMSKNYSPDLGRKRIRTVRSIRNSFSFERIIQKDRRIRSFSLTRGEKEKERKNRIRKGRCRFGENRIRQIREERFELRCEGTGGKKKKKRKIDRFRSTMLTQISPQSFRIVDAANVLGYPLLHLFLSFPSLPRSRSRADRDPDKIEHPQGR